MIFQPHSTDSWITKNNGAIEYLIRRTCGTYYVYNYSRYVGAAVSQPDAEKLARNDDARVKIVYGKA